MVIVCKYNYLRWVLVEQHQKGKKSNIKASSLQILGTITRLQVKAPSVTKDEWQQIINLTEQIEKSAMELKNENPSLKEAQIPQEGPRLKSQSTHRTDHSEGTLTDNLRTVLKLNNITAADVEGARGQTNPQYHTNEETTTNVQRSKSTILKRISEQKNQIRAKQQQTLLSNQAKESSLTFQPFLW